MCLSIPGKIIRINGDLADVSVGGTIVIVGMQMIDDVKEGDYVLVHAGFALQKINKKEALETLKLFREMGEE
ncbi:MAG: hydrogenase assembly protein HypC [Bacteroidetes bacterium GWF2_33_16]|nr:MAG: hydrogenase assembly protein HypC [Bacteroidetes bacterium GWE2_32_14]OFY06549.1 MAG: hydrogenase assembly protein HypC [Bacteroidetes bacterium GWF2_33_16]